MTSFDSAPSTLANPDRLYLEIPEIAQTLPQRPFSTPGACWRACLNQMTVEAFLPWLQEEHEPRARVWTSATTLPSVWEFVNGTAISGDGVRMVLIPSEAIDTEELRVPQEWVDIPTWTADYYVSIQVNPDQGWIQILGYTTHQRLKTRGFYDAGDRTYSLNADELIHDLNVLWLARDYCPTELPRAEVISLPAMPLTQATNLIGRLGDGAIALPRLEVPFQLWGALLEHGGWRQRLYEQRQGLPEQWSVPRWLQAGVSNLGQQLGWGRSELQFASVRGMRSAPATGIIRRLEIAGTSYELQVFPSPEASHPNGSWRFELRRLTANDLIPAGFTLRLLTEDLQPFENNEDRATEAVECLYVDVMLEPGEGLVWKVDPTPENYDREILRF
ncbi:MAG: DUF1822 family protein [Leptolyngbyaceae cyanobacterium RU_5_1]|nr:DUF1822 family protein [Leptolyngbyaceae cyanobacterium RU_5_1]